MKKVLWIIATALIFYGGCTRSISPIWSLVESRSIRDVGLTVPHYFPFIAYDGESKTNYVIARYLNLQISDSNTTAVVDLSDTIVSNINRQITTRAFSSPSTHKYFDVISRNGAEYDVVLEIPTRHESKTKGWYRIANGKIEPQRVLSYGPGFALIVMPFSFIVGVLASTTFWIATRRFRQKLPNKAVKVQNPAAGF